MYIPEKSAEVCPATDTTVLASAIVSASQLLIEQAPHAAVASYWCKVLHRDH